MGKKIKILIVDDASIDRQILSSLFDAEYEIFEADNGMTAMGILEKNEIDIIILDIIMPEMDGFDFLQLIKQNPRYKYISVIISTEAGSAENEYRALKLGADNFITKPYNPNIIKYRVKNLIDTYINRNYHLEREVKDARREVKSLMEATTNGIAVARKQDCYRLSYFNDKLAGMLGYTKKEAAGLLDTDVFSFIYEEDKEAVRELLETEAVKAKSTCCRVRMRCRDGSVIETEMNTKLSVMTDGTKVYYSAVTDITKLRERETSLKKKLCQLEERIKLDTLTGIYNQETFLSETAQLLAHHPKEQFIIGQWNIDRFKAVNELFGTRAGDRIICEFANYLKSHLTDLCTYGRVEADHFLTCCPESYLKEHVKELEALLAGRISWHNLNYSISLHVGFYRIEQSDDNNIALMCDRAEMALQQIRDSFVQREKYFNTELRESLVLEQRIMRDAETALLKHQFYIVYQPIVDVKTRKIIAAEALVRWKKPKEAVAPNDFIPIFEKNGFISRLDLYVWEEVCRYQSERQKNGQKIVPISVNLSRIDFYNTSLLSDISGLIEKYSLTPNCLKLEITESAYMDQPQELMSAIQQFQKNGFQILMDDFGSGYSSLNMLKDVNVDILKVDMHFMEALETSDRAGNILYSIIRMAKAIHMRVIAEGVENANQYELLSSMDCDGVQGYYFYEPLSQEEFGTCLDMKTEDAEPVEDVKENAVLIVDDNEIERELLKDLIGDEYQVYLAAGVDEALDILKKKFSAINLVISDIIMPDKDGFELIQAMKEIAYLSVIPILMVTAYGEYERIKQALMMGAIDVVTKPYDAVTFKQRLKNLLKMSAHETTVREIYSLRENAGLNRQLDSLFEKSNIGIARIRLSYDERDTIKEIIYINNRFLYLHGLQQQELWEKKSFQELARNVVTEDRRKLVRTLNSAKKNRETNLNLEYCIELDDGTEKSIYTACTLQYEKEFVVLDIFLIEGGLNARAQYDKTIQALSGQLMKKRGMEIWKHYIAEDITEYYQLDEAGSFVKRIVRNGRSDMINSAIFQNKDRARLRRMCHEIVAGRIFMEEEFQIYSPNGKRNELSWIRMTVLRITDYDEENGIVLGISENIEQEKKYKERKWREQQYKEIFTKDTELFAEVDLTENCFVSEESIHQFTNGKKKKDTSYDAMLEIFLDTVSAEDKGRCESMLNRENLLKWYQEEEREVKFDFISNRNQTAEFKWYTSDMYLVENAEDNHIYASWQVKNIQHEKQRINNMKQLAERDNLTGLYNRIMLEKSMDLNLASDQKGRICAFYMVDVDNFKAVNDNFGHDFGDSMLKAIGKLLVQTFRAEDVVARIGGDEFAVFISNANSQDWVVKRAQEICDNSFTELENEEKKICVSCSVGIVFGNEKGSSFKELYPLADKALYKAKKKGKNCYEIYTEDLRN